MGERVQSAATTDGGDDHSGVVVQWGEMSGPEDLGVDDGFVAEETPSEEGEKPAVEEAAEAVEAAEPNLTEAESQDSAKKTPTEEPKGLSEEQLAALRALLAEQKKAPEEKTPEQLAAEAAERTRVENERMAKVVEELEKEYAVPEEDVPLLITEPEKALPKLAARLHVQVMNNVMNQVQQMMVNQVPQVLQQQQELRGKETAAKEAFFSVNKDLVGHEAAVLQVGGVYRQMNPKATPEQAIKAIGELVRVSLGLKPLAGGEQTQQSTGAIRPAGTGSPPSRGATPAKPAPKGDVDWASLASEDD